MAIIGYIRVSTKEQNTARQEVNLAGCERTFVDRASGKNTENRPELGKLMDYVREGDTVVVDSYSRFARNTRDLLTLVERLKAKGVAFRSIKENVDTSTAAGKLVMTIFAGLAEFEREQTLQRQAEGIAIAKQDGKYLGRVAISIDKAAFAAEVKAWREGKQTAKATMGKLGLKPNTFYRRVKDLGL